MVGSIFPLLVTCICTYSNKNLFDSLPDFISVNCSFNINLSRASLYLANLTLNAIGALHSVSNTFATCADSTGLSCTTLYAHALNPLFTERGSYICMNVSLPRIYFKYNNIKR